MAAEDEFFKLLGKIEVDNESLKKSLGESENLVRKSGERLQRIWAEGITPKRAEGSTDDTRSTGGGLQVGGKNVSTGASIFSKAGQEAMRAAELAEITRRGISEKMTRSGGGRGAFDEMGEGAENAGSKFSHLSRITRELLTGPLGELSPEMAQVANATAYAARSATALGVGWGMAVVAGVLISETIGKFIEKAKEATAITVDLKQAMATLDVARADAGIKKIGEALALYNVQMDQATGKEKATFWQKVAAAVGVATEVFTGSLDKQIEDLARYATVSEYIASKITTPLALADSQKKAADILGRQAQVLMSNAVAAEAVAAAYDMQDKATIRSTESAKQKLKIENEAKIAAATQPFKDAAAKILKEAEQQAGAMGKDEQGQRLRKSIMADAVKRSTEVLEPMKGITDRINKELKIQLEDLDKGLEQSLVESANKRSAAYLKEAETAASSAKAIISAEESLLSVRREQFGVVESATHMEERLAQVRLATLAPIQAGIEAISARYKAQRSELEQVAKANLELSLRSKITDEERKTAQDAHAEATAKLNELDKYQTQDVEAAKRKEREATAQLDAQEAQARQARMQAEIAMEEKASAHRIAMGRETIRETESNLRAAAVDPRRTLDQQRKAEEDLATLRMTGAQNYFKLFESLGRPQFEAQLDFTKQIVSENVSGSDKWYKAVQEVANVYQRIHDTAKGIFQTQVSIAEQEAKKQGRTRIRRSEIGGYFSAARARANRTLMGDQAVEFGELSSALNVHEAGQAADRQGMSPGQALMTAMQDPAQKLADTIAQVSTSVATQSTVAKEGSEAMAGLGSAAGDAASALRDMAEAARMAKDTFGGGTKASGAESPTAEQPTRNFLSSNGVRSYTNLPSSVSSSLGKMSADESKRGVAGQADL